MWQPTDFDEAMQYVYTACQADEYNTTQCVLTRDEVEGHPAGIITSYFDGEEMDNTGQPYSAIMGYVNYGEEIHPSIIKITMNSGDGVDVTWGEDLSNWPEDHRNFACTIKSLDIISD